MKYFIAIPTYNGGDIWREVVLNIQRHAPAGLQVQIIDSSSKDDTVSVARKEGFSIESIPSVDFNHGGTRNIAVSKHSDECDIVIFLTQDA
ncbi:glycosyltransferase, partial [Escherichia coli]|nr:glycosyltransferase [Escherichia coli]